MVILMIMVAVRGLWVTIYTYMMLGLMCYFNAAVHYAGGNNVLLHNSCDIH